MPNSAMMESRVLKDLQVHKLTFEVQQCPLPEF